MDTTNMNEFTLEAPAVITLRDSFALRLMGEVFKNDNEEDEALRREDYAEFVRVEVDAAYTWADVMMERRKVPPAENYD